MSEDRELLKLAAKAAGIEIVNCTCGNEKCPFKYALGGTRRGHWNPLADDGDALRLAVNLKIDIEWQATSIHPLPHVEAYRRDDEAGIHYCASEHENDYRRAIVRAAAEIGKDMP